MNKHLRLLTALLACTFCGSAFSQSLLMPDGKDGVGVVVNYISQSEANGYGVSFGVSTKGRSDAAFSAIVLKKDGTEAYGFSLSYTPYLRPPDTTDVPVMVGFPFALGYTKPPGEHQEDLLVGGIGLELGLPIPTGQGSQFSVSVGGGLNYLLSDHSDNSDRLKLTAAATVAQSVPIEPESFFLLSASVGYLDARPGIVQFVLQVGLLFMG